MAVLDLPDIHQVQEVLKSSPALAGAFPAFVCRPGCLAAAMAGEGKAPTGESPTRPPARLRLGVRVRVRARVSAPARGHSRGRCS